MSSTNISTVAAVDLGSNSFHMIVARIGADKPQIIDRLRENVRLAAGLGPDRQLAPAAQQRALACLERFGQRLQPLTPAAVRVIGTNTLRQARNADAFLAAAEQILGHPVEVVSGIEEARLIYLGVTQNQGDPRHRRLVVDIGGGSTELILGHGAEPRRMESLYMGCVSMTQHYFPDGRITAKRLEQAELAARQELEPLEYDFRQTGWEVAIGASGTIRAVDKVIRAQGWSTAGITGQALAQLRDMLLAAGHAERLQLNGLKAERAPVLAGGLAILRGLFAALPMNSMQVSDGALREGVIDDLAGRVTSADVREQSVADLARRYHVDTEQAQRVAVTAGYCFAQVDADWDLAGFEGDRLLQWAAWLHEIGLDVAHSQYHKHGAYIASRADLAGFSQQDQQRLASLIRAHRRKFTASLFDALPAPWAGRIRRLAALLRLAVVLHRNRHPEPLPAFQLTATGDELTVCFPAGWLQARPLTQADLEQEARYFQKAGLKLRWR